MKELIGLFCILSFTFRILASMIKALYYVQEPLFYYQSQDTSVTKNAKPTKERVIFQIFHLHHQGKAIDNMGLLPIGYQMLPRMQTRQIS